MTIMSPGKGKWVHNGVEYVEKVIPVEIMCEESEIKKILDMTVKHYRQKALLAFAISSETFYIENPSLI